MKVKKTPEVTKFKIRCSRVGQVNESLPSLRKRGGAVEREAWEAAAFMTSI